MKKLQYETRHRYCFLGPKKLHNRSFYVLGRIEAMVGEGENNQFLSFTFCPVAIWKRGLLVQLEADHDWKDYLQKKISEMEG